MYRTAGNYMHTDSFCCLNQSMYLMFVNTGLVFLDPFFFGKLIYVYNICHYRVA